MSVPGRPCATWKGVIGCSSSRSPWPGDRVTSVVFGSRTLAAGVGDRVVLWDLTRRPPLADRPQVGSTIAAAYDRGSTGGVVLWDARRRTRLADKPLEIAEGSPISVAYSPDGMALAAGFMRTDL